VRKVPEMMNIFSYIFTGNDLLTTDEGYLVKDLSPILYGRQVEDVIVIETD
jgi:hypothetical protein